MIYGIMILPAPPNLVTIKKDGKNIDAVAQVTKQGYIFLFDRETGNPLFPIEERPVAFSPMPDEQSWPTQPFLQSQYHSAGKSLMKA